METWDVLVGNTTAVLHVKVFPLAGVPSVESWNIFTTACSTGASGPSTGVSHELRNGEVHFHSCNHGMYCDVLCIAVIRNTHLLRKSN